MKIGKLFVIHVLIQKAVSGLQDLRRTMKISKLFVSYTCHLQKAVSGLQDLRRTMKIGKLFVIHVHLQ